MQLKQLMYIFKTPVLRLLLVFMFLVFLFRIAWLIPPVQSPDEFNHLYRAQMLSMGQWFLKPKPDQQDVSLLSKGSQVGGWVDPALLAYKDLHWPLVLDPQSVLSVEEKVDVSNIRWSQTKTYVNLPGAGYYFPLIYTPQAAGFAIGRLLNWSVENSYWLCRFLTTLSCFAILFLSLRIFSPPPLALALLLLPMSVFQFLSPTIDGLASAMSVLALSIFIKLCDDLKRPDYFSSWSLALIILVIVSSRTHLITFLLFPFYIAWRHRSSRDFGIGLVVAFVAISWIAFAIWSTQDGRIVNRIGTSSQLIHYLKNPFEFFHILWQTLKDSDTFLHYQRSFVGILGWLNVLLPEIAYPLIWSGLGVCTWLSAHLYYHRRGGASYGRLLLLVLGCLSAIMVFFAMLTTWTPANATIIEGVQGRYFTVPSLMVAYAFTEGPYKRQNPWPWSTRLAIFGFALVSFSALILALLARYD